MLKLQPKELLFKCLSKIFKKLILALAISASVARRNKEAKNEAVMLEKVQCIYYLLCFQKNFVDIEVLINFGNEVNTMTLAYASN